MNHILFEQQEGLAIIRFNRPKVFNSFNKEMAFEFQEILDKCKSDDSIRAVYITGEGKAFCAGQDLQEIMDPNGPPLSDIVSKHYNPAVMRIRNIEKPIISAINGVAAGAGANIALACDIAVATESASFIQAFSKIGLIPDSGGTFTLPRIIGFAKASALMMTGDKVSAAEAERLGMIYKYFPDESFAEESLKLAYKMAKMPTKGLGLTKRLLNMSFTNNLKDQLAMEHELQVEASETYDYNEGVTAFLEKRKATFKGH